MAEKILVVDDEKEIADLVALYLENENYQVYKYCTTPVMKRMQIFWSIPALC